MIERFEKKKLEIHALIGGKHENFEKIRTMVWSDLANHWRLQHESGQRLSLLGGGNQVKYSSLPHLVSATFAPVFSLFFVDLRL